jgi:F0F1-type ATP synthase assembly protein I
MDPEVKKSLKGGLEFSALGLQMGLCIGLGVYLGWLYDQHYGDGTTGVMVGAALGLGAAGSSFYRAYLKAKKMTDDPE